MVIQRKNTLKGSIVPSHYVIYKKTKDEGYYLDGYNSTCEVYGKIPIGSAYRLYIHHATISGELFQHVQQLLGKGGHIMKDLEKFKIIEECEKNAVPDSQIDTSEIPEVTDFSKFLSLSQHDKYFKPVKEQVSIRFYKVLLDHLRSKGRGWQSELNNFLMSAFLQGQI